MVRKKCINETMTTVMIDGSPVTLTLDEDPAFAGLRSSLAEINKVEGVKGYILRNTTSAVIDLQNPAKLVEYALLSSQATDACQEISDLFKLDITKTVVEGRDVKVLCMIIGENRLSVFMEKTVDHADILRRISP
jgi:predicted regulator of Ras-like GTPase activity (Roadblock/LC7/MglB family)